jgi:membrane protein DedA with SNARE-associated domain
MALPPPDTILSEAGRWAYLVVSLVLLLEAVPVLGALIPAQLFLLGAGFLASIGELRLVPLLLVAVVSLFVADVISFAMGRRFGLRLLKRLPAAFAARAQAVSDGLGQHIGKTMTLGKFLGPARALAPPLAGNARVSWLRFLVWEAIGCVIWCVVIIGAGFVFGKSYERIEKLLGRGSLVLLLAVFIAIVAVYRYRMAKKHERDVHRP